MFELFINEEKTTKILHDSTRRVIMLKFSGSVKVVDYKHSMELILKLAKEYQYHKVIFDLSDAESTPAIGRAWFVTQFGPRAYREIGNMIVCMLLSKRSAFQNKASELVVKSMQALKLNITISFEEDLDAALESMAQS
ncbi:MAG: hypothetical protein EAZ57_06915 [Cytophagales bacterium]|nr:MAG: hypothetical protein EAZ67_07620 [Cytophagales bacterium]TAF60587.1 MAG: hypothetical protein EAZ57_06915 [Cytophagales bacterium]